MSAFIVSGGALLEVGCPSTLTRNTEQQVGFRTTLGGKRKAFIRKGGRRAWSVDVSVARPAEVSTLEAVARGLGPYGWYPPEAVVGNLLSPQSSGFDDLPDGATDAGLVQLPDGSVARAITLEAVAAIGLTHGDHERVPVTAGKAVSLGVWARNGARLSGWWRDANGTQLTSFASATFSFSGWGWRQASFTPPTAAAFLSMHVSAGSMYARPSVSWGAVARDELGTGCPQALIHSPSHAPVALWEGANYTDSSYSVTEVG